MQEIRILIVDDDEAVRKQLRSLLASHPHLLVCGEAGDGLEAVERARELRPHIVLMDVSMPKMDGLKATKIIREDAPDCEVLIVSQNDPSIVAQQAASVRAGGFVAKSRLGQDLISAIDRSFPVRPSSKKPGNGNGVRTVPAKQNGSQPQTSSLQAKVRKRFGVLPNFFRLCPETPEITANMWGFAQAAYLDNPLPSLFKERLFVHLSRFCSVRYCIARHVGFLAGLGHASGDSRVPPQTIEEIVLLLRRSVPRGEELARLISLYGEATAPLAEMPESGSDTEAAIFALATQMFLQTADAARYQDAMKALLGDVRLQYLILLLAFVRSAHYWTLTHAKLTLEDDIKELLATHEALAECIFNDPEANVGEAGARIVSELPPLNGDSDYAASLLAAIVDSSYDAIVSKNLNGIITSWNKAAEHVFGYTAEEAIGQHITLIIPPGRQDEEAEILARIRRGERTDQFDTIRRRKDGALIDVSLTISPVKDARGRIIGASKVARDTTERKRAEVRERQITVEAMSANAKFRAVFEQTTVFAGIMTQDGVLVEANNIWLEGCGYKPEEVLGHRLWETAWWRDYPESQEKIRAAVPEAVRGVPYREVLKYSWADGSEHVVDFALYPLLDDRGRILFLHPTGIDITDLKRGEQAYRKLAETLDAEVRERTKELEARNLELQRRSEEIRILSRRMMQIQDNERRHIARELHDSAGQMLTVLGIDLARIRHEAKRSPKITKLAQETEELVHQLSQEIRTTSYLLHPPLLDESGLRAALSWYVRGLSERSGLAIQLNVPEDFGRLSEDLELVVFRLVQECLTNIHRHSGSKTATINLARRSETVLLEVQDQGKGIRPAKLAEIQSQSPGVGIRGMRERVTQFGGQIELESSSSGTKVAVTLPVPAIPEPAQDDESRFLQAAN